MPRPNPLKDRHADYPIEEIFLKRWSPRAMSRDMITRQQLMTLFEAARWAPSTYNEQEWRYLYAMRDSEYWQLFFNLLSEANQAWCGNASTLVVVLSCKVFEKNGKSNPLHSFDAGASFENLALQGAAMNLVVHGMAGFDQERARSDLGVPDSFSVEAMIAIGLPGDPSELPLRLQKQETVSSRRTLDKTVFEGRFRS